MPVSAGQIIRASDVGRSKHDAAAEVDLTTTTSFQDVEGAQIVFTTTKANVEAVVTAFADIEHTTAGGGVGIVGLNVDGVSEVGQVILDDAAVRGTVGQVWNLVLPVAEQHTLKLEGRKTIAAGTCVINAPHTRIVAAVDNLAT